MWIKGIKIIFSADVCSIKASSRKVPDLHINMRFCSPYSSQFVSKTLNNFANYNQFVLWLLVQWQTVVQVRQRQQMAKVPEKVCGVKFSFCIKFLFSFSIMNIYFVDKQEEKGCSTCPTHLWWELLPNYCWRINKACEVKYAPQLLVQHWSIGAWQICCGLVVLESHPHEAKYAHDWWVSCMC